jgi:hypothetical protein
VLTVYQWVVPTPQPATPTQRPAPPASQSAPPAQQPDTVQQPPVVQLPAGGTEPAAAPVETLKADASERTITIDNGLVRAVFTNRGAALTRWELSQYKGPAGTPVDLVPHDVPADQPKPFSLRLDDRAKSARLNTALFASSSAQTLDARSQPVTLTFEYEDAGGLHAQSFTSSPILRRDLHRRRHRWRSGRHPTVQWGAGLGDVLAGTGGGMFTQVRRAEAIMSSDGDVERIQPADRLRRRGTGIMRFAASTRTISSRRS